MSGLKIALRQLLRTPGFTAIALLTLALGIGVNTAMFSAVNGLLLQPAPYPRPEQLVRLFRTGPALERGLHSLPDLRDHRAQTRTLQSLTAYSSWTYSLGQPGQPAEQVAGVTASADLLTTLGLQPLLGRGFSAAEQQPGRDRVVILGHGFWQARFAGDRAVLGRQLRIDGEAVTVIGVMPASADYPAFWGQVQLWRPLTLGDDWRKDRSVRWLNAVGRLREGVTREAAEAELKTVAARVAQQHPEAAPGSVRLAALHRSTLDELGRNLTWLLLGLAGFVLLIACANIANLQIARGAARTREVAVRLALGAPPARLMGGLLLESVWLALAGGALGLLLAAFISDGLASRLGGGLRFPLDLRVMTFALGLSLAAGVLAGCGPAWLAVRGGVNAGLARQSRGSTTDRSRHLLRQGLIVVEMAFALVLLAGAGFFLRGLERFTGRDPGWQTSGLLAGTLTLPVNRYGRPEERVQFHRRLLERLQALPGVQSAALASSLPIQPSTGVMEIEVEGRAPMPAGQGPQVQPSYVSPDLFATLGLQLVDGELLSRSTRPGDPRQVVINQSLAEGLWPGQSAVGKRLRSTNPEDAGWHQVVGVVRDVALAGHFGGQVTAFQLYRPMVHDPWGYFSLVLRAPASAVASLAAPVRRVVAELDGDLPVADLRTVEATLAEARRELELVNQLLAGFALLGLVLSALGLYGVVSSLVAQRRREFGIRLALGAQAGDVGRLVLGSGAVLLALGVGLGLLGATALLRVLAALVPGLPGQGDDPLGLLLVVALLAATALLACLLPARRASRVDPVESLRAE